MLDSDLKQAFLELAEGQKAFSASQEKNNREFRERMDRMEQEREKSLREFRERMEAMARVFQERDEKTRLAEEKAQQDIEATRQLVRESLQKTRQLEELFVGQWGKLVESLVEGKVVELLNARGIRVAETSTRLRGQYGEQQWEFDILAHNGAELVVIEVKTTLRFEDVDAFVDKLKNFKLWSPSHAGRVVYGAMAYLRADASSDVVVQKRGLYAIRATGDSARIVNRESFKPRVF